MSSTFGKYWKLYWKTLKKMKWNSHERKGHYHNSCLFSPKINPKFHKIAVRISTDLIVSSPAYGGEQRALGQSGWFALISKTFYQVHHSLVMLHGHTDSWTERQLRQTCACVLQVLGNDEDGSADQQERG